MSLVNLSKIIHGSYVDGPNHRAAVYLQGCSIQCPGCQSPHTHAPDAGETWPVERLAQVLILESGKNITISGGEPFDQLKAVRELLAKLKTAGKHIIMYSGYTWEHIKENIFHRSPGEFHEFMSMIDVLVDGPYIWQLDSPDMQYRGSSNQRVIDVPASLENKSLILLNWDRPEIIINKKGQIITTGPLADLLSGWGLGQAKPTRRCGQSN